MDSDIILCTVVLTIILGPVVNRQSYLLLLLDLRYTWLTRHSCVILKVESNDKRKFNRVCNSV